MTSNRAVAPVRGTVRRLSAFAAITVLSALGVAHRSSALIITGSADLLPGGGSCSISGNPCQTGGAVLNCSGINLAAHTKVYFGIKNSVNVFGNTMTGSAPAAASASVFRFSSDTANSITYASTTTIPDNANGTQPVASKMILTRTSGTASVVATGGTPGNNNNGDIQDLFQIGSSSFSLRVDLTAQDPFLGPGQACPVVYDPTQTPAPGGGEFSKIDLTFYYSDCGDGQFDSPEQCDDGAGNGTLGSCCTTSCQFKTSGTVCRFGAGAPCDSNEACTGLSGSCPPDDAPLNMGTVCRAGSGDICDQNETCTGVPGQGCPPDDAPTNVTVVCRVGSVGDICNEDELCTGVPGVPCPPDDAPLKINLVCRPGSGDVCDPDERCTGNAGQGCPPDVVAPPTTVCRNGAGDMCDPAEHCTAVPGQACPANFVTPAGTTCRAAAGQCDVAEQCTGVAGQLCPSNGFAPATTSCNADSNVCTIDHCNGSGTCVFGSNLNCEDGNACTQDSCDPQNGCVSVGAPSNTCVAAGKAILKIKDSPNDTKDQVKFLWRGGPALVSNMGDPTQTTRYELCIYDNGGVRMAMGVPPGPNWKLLGSTSAPKGYMYKDLASSNDGIKLIKTKGSSLDTGKAKVVGRGNSLPDTATLPFDAPVTAQLYASDGMCWTMQFQQGNMKKNTGTGFTASAP